jgi:hypothetical protein
MRAQELIHYFAALREIKSKAPSSLHDKDSNRGTPGLKPSLTFFKYLAACNFQYEIFTP